MLNANCDLCDRPCMEDELKEWVAPADDIDEGVREARLMCPLCAIMKELGAIVEAVPRDAEERAITVLEKAFDEITQLVMKSESSDATDDGHEQEIAESEPSE